MPRQILLVLKLKAHGIDDGAINWIKQFVVIIVVYTTASCANIVLYTTTNCANIHSTFTNVNIRILRTRQSCVIQLCTVITLPDWYGAFYRDISIKLHRSDNLSNATELAL